MKKAAGRDQHQISEGTLPLQIHEHYHYPLRDHPKHVFQTVTNAHLRHDMAEMPGQKTDAKIFGDSSWWSSNETFFEIPATFEMAGREPLYSYTGSQYWETTSETPQNPARKLATRTTTKYRQTSTKITQTKTAPDPVPQGFQNPTTTATEHGQTPAETTPDQTPRNGGVVRWRQNTWTALRDMPWSISGKISAGQWTMRWEIKVSTTRDTSGGRPGATRDTSGEEAGTTRNTLERGHYATLHSLGREHGATRDNPRRGQNSLGRCLKGVEEQGETRITETPDDETQALAPWRTGIVLGEKDLEVALAGNPGELDMEKPGSGTTEEDSGESLGLATVERPWRAASNVDGAKSDSMPILVQNQKIKAYPLRVRKLHQFRQLTEAPPETVISWFTNSGITLGPVATTPDQRMLVMKLCYTYQECFVNKIEDIRTTDLIQHYILTKPDALPVKQKPRRYGRREQEAAREIFPQMERIALITRGMSPWGANIVFVPKPVLESTSFARRN